MKSIRKFLVAETGAVTVDWVVLTMAVIVVGLATVTLAIANTGNVADVIADTVESAAP